MSPWKRKGILLFHGLRWPFTLIHLTASCRCWLLQVKVRPKHRITLPPADFCLSPVRKRVGWLTASVAYAQSLRATLRYSKQIQQMRQRVGRV